MTSTREIRDTKAIGQFRNEKGEIISLSSIGYQLSKIDNGQHRGDLEMFLFHVHVGCEVINK